MAPDPRIGRAFSAMRAIGIQTESVKAVLKNMLRLYDYNWELIEAENYHALADAIFEYEEAKLVGGTRKSDVGHDDFDEPQPIGIHSEEQDDQWSPEMLNPEYKFAKGNDKGVNKQDGCKNPSQMHNLEPVLASEENKNEGEEPFSTRKRKIENNDCKGIIVKPKIERLLSNSSHDGVPPSFVHSGTMVAHNPEKNCTKPSTSQHCSSKKKNGFSSTFNSCSSCKSSFEIASSPTGEVKISVNCNAVCEQPNFHIPNLDTVLKYIENKYLRSYKIVGPEFSVKKLLKDLCTSFLEMGTGNSMNKNIIGNLKDKSRKRERILDISNGLEKMEIPLVDESGNEAVPRFVYISQNTVYQNAYLDISLARIADEDCCSSCSGNCLLSSISCACARETGGEFAYTPLGLLKEEFLRACISMSQEPQNHHFFYCQPIERCKNENITGPCKGHLVRKFIKECWRKCGCHLRCGNRVVQRGITRKLQVFLTGGGKGWGVRSLEDMPKGAFVCEYIGEILTNTELWYRNEESSGKERHTYPVLLDADWGSEGILNDEEALCLDATYYGNVARFINHRCVDGNLLEIPVEIENPDHHYYHIAFFTKRQVPAMEELTWDYGIDFSDDDHPVKAFQCSCGSASCRDRQIQNKRY